MPTYVALLRGVNVGSAKRVPMGEWRTLLEAMGYTRVATLLNSGNAAFCATGRRTAKAHAAAIAEGLSSQLHVQVPVIVKPASELAAIGRSACGDDAQLGDDAEAACAGRRAGRWRGQLIRSHMRARWHLRKRLDRTCIGAVGPCPRPYTLVRTASTWPVRGFSSQV